MDKKKLMTPASRWRWAALAVALTFPVGVFVGMHVATVGFENLRGTDITSSLVEFGDEAGKTARSLLQSARGPYHTLPKIPQGPHTDTYDDHLWSEVHWDLVYDSHSDSRSTNVSITETLLMANDVAAHQLLLLTKIHRFRKYLVDQDLSTLDGIRKKGNVPFMDNLDMTDIYKAAINFSDDELQAQLNGRRCPCDAKKRPVLNMAIVIPLEMKKLDMTWSLLESLRQLTVFPKEVVFTLGNTGSSRAVNVASFVELLRTEYVPDIPDETQIKVFTSQRKSFPGDSRWFGFNQTTADIVSLFDNDDYLHPQFFHIFWRIFKKRPELDFALMIYEAGTADGQCSEDMYFPFIGQFLAKNIYSEERIAVGESYAPGKYEELWGLVPTFDKEWWLGNTDAEPNWDNDQSWWDMGCHNGWSTFRRYVMELIPPPVRKFGGEDAIWNFRIGRSKFNYRCIELVMGCFLKDFCHN